ncbi:ribosomal protein S14, S11 [Puccinia graminis f. sp. tritici]|uniref:Ribosomal protein S14, S11 n=1 Tax=Puccinia graminis f. sp. tritici TaxID=56615 RepID=A0A5B0LUE4_PUCGR|nr:ribosomal protein S14, S11 [Puccinia graminis f. sp. tritici]KAA1071464.1 ribosomal protein S14, S11 [Puccinia graminis f. sp. tritici]
MIVSFKSTFVVVADVCGRQPISRVPGGMIVRADRNGSSPHDTRLAARDVALQCNESRSLLSTSSSVLTVKVTPNHLGPVDKPTPELLPVRVCTSAELRRPPLSLPAAHIEDERHPIYKSSDWSSHTLHFAPVGVVGVVYDIAVWGKVIFLSCVIS